MSKPRVTAHAHIQAASTRARLCQDPTYVTPGVDVEVTFDLHDHEAALTMLERAVADVRSQIEEIQP